MRNNFVKKEASVFRILDRKQGRLLCINMNGKCAPQWFLERECGTAEYSIPEDVVLSSSALAEAHRRFSMLLSILPHIGDKKEMGEAVREVAEEHHLSRPTVRKYLYRYLTHQSIAALSAEEKKEKRPLTRDEKNFRWALNKYFYTSRKNSLMTAYMLMLKERYYDGEEILEHPSFYQFRYFYRKTKKWDNFYITRGGMKDYQKNHRPLLGGRVQEYAPAVGVGMLDSTVCDIYLVDQGGSLIGRPLLTVCIDAYSGLCCGYSLGWEGGVSSLRKLLNGILEDKTELCRKHGILIKEEDWPCRELPGKMITDMGGEYISEEFAQITELGVTMENLPAFRPDQKGPVEKFFDVIQGYYKPHLKGCGVVEPDFGERGARDYRLDARFTLEQFEAVLLRCILYYNKDRILENFPYTEEMIALGVQPYCNTIWEYGKTLPGAHLITADREQIRLSMLPRTIGTFRRNGLIVNRLRYRAYGFVDQYLTGETVLTAYDPACVDDIYLIQNGMFIRFELIETRYQGKSLEQVMKLLDGQKAIVKEARKKNQTDKIRLIGQIQEARKVAKVLRSESEG